MVQFGLVQGLPNLNRELFFLPAGLQEVLQARQVALTWPPTHAFAVSLPTIMPAADVSSVSGGATLVGFNTATWLQAIEAAIEAQEVSVKHPADGNTWHLQHVESRSECEQMLRTQTGQSTAWTSSLAGSIWGLAGPVPVQGNSKAGAERASSSGHQLQLFCWTAHVQEHPSAG